MNVPLFSRRSSATASSLNIPNASPAVPLQTRNRKPDHLIRALEALQKKTKGVDTLESIHEQAGVLVKLLKKHLHSAKTSEYLGNIRACIGNITSVLTPANLSAHSDILDTVTGDILEGLENLQSILENSLDNTGYAFAELEVVPRSEKVDSEVIGRLNHGYITLDQLIRPDRYEANGALRFRANAAVMNVDGDIGSGSYGPSITELSYSKVESQGSVASRNDFRGHSGAKMLAFSANLKAKGDILSALSGDIKEIEVNGARMTSTTGDILSRHNNTRSMQS